MTPYRANVPARDRGLASRLRQLLSEPGLLRGSLVEMRRRCGTRTCGCQRDPTRRHRALYLGLRLNGKTRMVYIPAAWEARVRRWTARYAAVREVLEQLSRECLARLERRED